MELIQRVLIWAQRNERHLGAALFVFGFITDLLTFTLLPVTAVNLAFLGYLALATISTLGSHLFSESREDAKMWRRALSIVFPLAAQYAIGSLLSGCLIFYTKSAALFVSWPFLLLLVLVFIGNEYFRTYYKHLAFQVVLLFFALYAYSIFALPLIVHKLGPWVFVESTVLSVLAFASILFLLAKIQRAGFKRSLRYVVPGVSGIIAAMSLCYFTGLIPPIPLTLPTVGIYHKVEHRDGQYVVTREQVSGLPLFRSSVVHHVPGTPLFAFTAVSAPIDFETSIVHVWEYYDNTRERWIERNRISFVIAGGRDGGYRGYSEVVNPEAGKWRLTVETAGGQVIGRRNFTIQNVEVTPLLTEEFK